MPLYISLSRSRSLKVVIEIAPFDTSHMRSYWRSIVSMALSCIISEIKQDIGRKLRFFIAPGFYAFDMSPRQSIAMFGLDKL